MSYMARFSSRIEPFVEYKSGRMNQLVHALKSKQAALSPHPYKERPKNDPMDQKLIKAAQQGKTKLYLVEDGFLLYKKEQRLYLLDWLGLRKIIHECHHQMGCPS